MRENFSLVCLCTADLMYTKTRLAFISSVTLLIKVNMKTGIIANNVV